MTTLPKGPLKIIAPIVKNALANRQRQGAGSTRYKPVWNVFVLDGETFIPHTALTFRTASLNPRHEPRGVKVAYPQANSAMRQALDAGLWFETRSAILLDEEVAAQTTEESTDNG